MNNFVITIEYHDSWDYSGPIFHYTVFGKTSDDVYVKFFSNLEKEMKLRKKNKASLEKELKRISKSKSDDDLYLSFEARQKYSDNKCFAFQDAEFDVEDFLLYDEEKWKIDYDMVSVKSLDDWFTKNLIKDK